MLEEYCCISDSNPTTDDNKEKARVEELETMIIGKLKTKGALAGVLKDREFLEIVQKGENAKILVGVFGKVLVGIVDGGEDDMVGKSGDVKKDGDEGEEEGMIRW